MKKFGVKINFDRLRGKVFNMDDIKHFFFCLKACKLTTHLIIIKTCALLPSALSLHFSDENRSIQAFKSLTISLQLENKDLTTREVAFTYLR